MTQVPFLLVDAFTKARPPVSIARLFDQEFTAPVGWVGIENRFRKHPRMSPWIEERALAFAIHVIGWFSENTSTGSLGTFKEDVDPRDTKRHGMRPGALLR